MMRVLRTRVCRRWWWWWCTVVCGALLCVCALPHSQRLHSERVFPAHTPPALAHKLADFSHQPHVESWLVEEDRSNYTWWRYAVSFRCGWRCAGHARVSAHAEHAGAPQHGHAARAHLVALTRTDCRVPPLLAWPSFCDELQWYAVLEAANTSADEAQAQAAGARLTLTLETPCGALAALTGHCQRRLHAYQDMLLANIT